MILLAIPDNQVSEQLTMLLKVKSISVIPYSSAASEINLPDWKNNIRLAIVDTDLPGINGYDLARFIREFESTSIPIILLAWFNISSLTMANDLGCTEILAKPVGVDEMLAVIEKYTHDFQG